MVDARGLQIYLLLHTDWNALRKIGFFIYTLQLTADGLWCQTSFIYNLFYNGWGGYSREGRGETLEGKYKRNVLESNFNTHQ